MREVNEQQSKAWNGPEAAHYVDHADRYDRQLAPFTEGMVSAAQITPQDAVLDIGCGCGATTLVAARRARTALGVDISAPLIDVATRRADEASVGNTEFVVADAQTHTFERAFDVVISQFGLMFFDEPVTAFANLRSALAPQGRLAFVSWRGIEANEWLVVLTREMARHLEIPSLGGLAAGPGMFALKDRDETAGLLDAAGFTQVEVQPLSPTIVLGGGGTLDESMDFLLGTGIVRGLLSQVEPDVHPEVISAVRDAVATRYESGVGVTLGAGGWLVTATT